MNQDRSAPGLLRDTFPGEELNKQMIGVVRGVVVGVPEPPSLSAEVLVRVPSIDSMEPLTARVAVQLAGPLHGTYFLPQVGMEVLLAFEDGNASIPYVIGCVWNASTVPFKLPMPFTQMIRTLSGSQIVFEELPQPTITIQSGPTSPIPIPMPSTPVTPPPTIQVSADGIDITSPLRITLSVGSTSITIMPEGVSIVGPEVTTAAAGQVVISGSLIRINS